MTTARSDDAIRSLTRLAGHAAGWDGRGAAAADAGSFVLATAFAVEGAALGLAPEASLHANGCAVLTYGDGVRHASVQFHADGVAGAYVSRDGEEWDGDVRVDDVVGRLHLMVHIAAALSGAGKGPTDAVRVNALVWRVDGVGKDETYVAETILGRYAAWEANGVGRFTSATHTRFEDVGRTAEDAKAAAQAHYDAKIRSALA